MITRWRRRQIERRLSSLRHPGEAFVAFERLGFAGWWALSDQALYALRGRGEPTRLPLREIRSVRVTSGSQTLQVTVTSTTDAIVGDLHPNSDLLQRIRDLPSLGSGPS